jgi:hypothetical protein
MVITKKKSTNFPFNMSPFELMPNKNTKQCLTYGEWRTFQSWGGWSSYILGSNSNKMIKKNL